MIGERGPQVGHLLERARGRHVADPGLPLQLVIPPSHTACRDASPSMAAPISACPQSSGRSTESTSAAPRTSSSTAIHVPVDSSAAVPSTRGRCARNTRIGLPVHRDLTCVRTTQNRCGRCAGDTRVQRRVDQAGEGFSHGHHVRVERLDLDEDVSWPIVQNQAGAEQPRWPFRSPGGQLGNDAVIGTRAEDVHAPHGRHRRHPRGSGYRTRRQRLESRDIPDRARRAGGRERPALAGREGPPWRERHRSMSRAARRPGAGHIAPMADSVACVRPLIARVRRRSSYNSGIVNPRAPAGRSRKNDRNGRRGCAADPPAPGTVSRSSLRSQA